MTRYGWIVLLAATTACSGNSSPAAPSTPACQTDKTAAVSFVNRSQVTLDLVVDNSVMATGIGPGAAYGPVTLAAGVAHSVQWRVTNTNILPCIPASPVFNACDMPVYGSCQ
jgi:hypothetical protein